MKQLLVATKNPGKLFEISKFLSDLSIKCVSLKDLNIVEEIEEDGKDYFENSAKKALFYAKLSNLPTIADDGGIEIDALGGMPGVKSRRWLGYEASDNELIKHMKKVSMQLPENNRTAYFRAVVTVALPTGEVFQEEGSVKGVIAKKPLLKLLKGYPFRSFFYLPTIKKYYHESDLSPRQEKIYNHRYIAIQKLKPFIKKYA